MSTITEAATSEAGMRLMTAIQAAVPEAQFHPNQAGAILAPAVMVWQGSPWIVPDGFHTVHERWEIVCAVSGLQWDRAQGQIYGLVVKVLDAAMGVGAIVEQVERPVPPDPGSESDLTTCAVLLRFKYNPATQP